MSEQRTINAYAVFEPKGEAKAWTYEAHPLAGDHVEIKISHCGICGSDLHTMDSGWGPTVYPCVVGHEIIGHVTQIGAEVTHLAVGDRVGVGAQVSACLNKDSSRPCTECAEGFDSYCSRIVYTYNSQYEDGHQAYGGYADYVRVNGHYAFKIPDAIPSDVAAPLLCAGATVFSPLKHQNVKPGDRVGVVGIGGLGHLAIQFIKALGATPVAFSHSPNKEAEVRALGAEDFVNLGDPEQVQKAQASVNVLLVTSDANGLPYNTFLSFVRPRGTYVALGIPNDEIKFNAFYVVGPGVSFVGSKIGSIADIKEMLQVAADKNVRPIIQKLPMEKVNEGIAMVRQGKARYRVVLENSSA